MCVCVCVFVCVRVCTLCVNVCVHIVCEHVCVCVCVHTHVCVYVCVCMYVCVRLCVGRETGTTHSWLFLMHPEQQEHTSTVVERSLERRMLIIDTVHLCPRNFDRYTDHGAGREGDH